MYKEYKTKMASSSCLKVVVFLGTVREGRVGLRVARFMKKYLEETNHEVELFDPVEIEFPMLTKPAHFYGPSRDGCPAWLADAEKKVKAADAYVLVSGEYNHCIPPALANMLDHFPGSAFAFKPSGIVCYSPGMYGGMRAAMQLRNMTGEIGCISVSNIFGIPKVHEAFDPEGNPLNDHMKKGAKKMVDQLDWMAHAMRNQREAVGVPT